MDKEKLRLIVKNLESLVDCLKSEIEFDNQIGSHDPQFYESIKDCLNDYDEVFYEDED